VLPAGYRGNKLSRNLGILGGRGPLNEDVKNVSRRKGLCSNQSVRGDGKGASSETSGVLLEMRKGEFGYRTSGKQRRKKNK